MRHTGKKVNARKSVKFVAAYLGQSHVPVRCPQQCPPASRMSHRIPNPRPSSAQITITIGRAAHNLKTHVEKKQREKFRGSIGRNLDHEWLCVCGGVVVVGGMFCPVRGAPAPALALPVGR